MINLLKQHNFVQNQQNGKWKEQNVKPGQKFTTIHNQILQRK